MLKQEYKYNLYINIKDKYIKKTFILLGLVLIGIIANKLNAMIDRTLASILGEGAVSALNYVNKLNLFIMALFITSIGTIIYPILSKLSEKMKSDKFVETINSVILFVTPISVGAIVYLLHL